MFNRLKWSRAVAVVVGAVLLVAGLVAMPTHAMAQHTSALCAAKSGSVTRGGTVSIDVSDCEFFRGVGGIGPVDGPAFPANGSAILRQTSTNWIVDYSHNGNTATSDVFEFADGSQNGNGVVRVTITITAATSSIIVSPGTLPVMTAGTPFTQTLSSSGGVGPYTYTLQSGALPIGLSLASNGVISGTPTQRGGYTFGVRSTGSNAEVTDKGYTGSVQNPSLSLASAAGTAIQGGAFSQTLATNGGVGPYSYLLESGSFPAGISISSAGVVSGTTNAAPGNYAVTLRVTDASTGPGSYFELETYTLTVGPPPTVSIAVSPASVDEDRVTNLTYTVTRSLNLSSPTVVNLTTSGTATSGTDFTGAASSVTIPANATTATLTINPTADIALEPNETVVLTVATGGGYSVGTPSSATATITNDDGASTYCPTLSATVANGGSVSIDVKDCDGPFNFGVVGRTAPTHGTLLVGPQSGPGTQFATYTHNGNSATTDRFELEDEDSRSIVVSITISPATSSIVVSPATLATLRAGVAFSQTLSATGGSGPYTYSVNGGALPAGITLASGTLSGTPTNRGGYSFSVEARDSLGAVTTKGYTGSVESPVITMSPTTYTVVQGAPTSFQLTVSGGVAPYSYLLEVGPALPAGLTVSSTGVVSGTPTTAGSTTPNFRVTDSSTGPGQYFELESPTINVTATPPSVSIAVAPSAVTEDGATNLVFTVSRSAALAGSTTVNLTPSGTATSGTDYTGTVTSVEIPGGALSASVTVNPTADTTSEADETVTLTVASGTGYSVGAPAAATGTIQNDDVITASIAVAPASVSEDGATNLVYTVTLSSAAPSPLNIAFNVSGTATSGTDYAAVTSPVSIGTGATTGTVTVNPTADTTIEADETIVLTLAAGAGYTVGAPAAATGTVLNDDLPTLTINDVTLGEGAAGTTNATFTVSLSQPAGPGGVTFDIAAANGTALAGSDYVANTLTGQTIPAGASTYSFTLQVNGDALNEPNETFAVNVTSVTGAVVGDGQGIGTIVNDDALPGLSISDVTIVEGNSGSTNAVFTVSLSAASGQTITVNHATTAGTATAGTDFTATSGTLTFTAGQTSATVLVPILGDTVPEASETFTVDLSGAVNATLVDATGLGTISNDDLPALSVNDVTITEGDAGTTNATFTVSLSSPALVGGVSFDIQTADDTATAGQDYVGRSLTAQSIAGGSSSYTFTVQVNGDVVDELNERFFANVSGVAGATVADGQGAGTITDDDATPTINISSASVVEGNSGSASIPVTFTLTGASSRTITANWRTSNGTATAGSDYTAASGSLSFAPGELTKTINVSVAGDGTVELDETFIVEFSSAPTNATGGPAGSVTIQNDDQPSLSINDVSQAEGDTGTTAFTFTVALSAPAPVGGVTFDVATTTLTATAGVDYAATNAAARTIAAGASSATFTVLVNGDTLNEPNETFGVNVGNVTGATVSDAQGLGTIVNDDAAPSLSITDVSVTEGDGGTTNAVFNVTLSAASAQDVTVNFTTADGTATAGSDYIAQSGALTFTAGTTSQTVSVVVNGDIAIEPGETFTVVLSGAVNASIADASGVATIVADDVAPSVTSLSPSSGLRAGGTAVTINGSGFTGATAVSFGGTPASSFTVISDTRIDAVSPPGLGTVNVGIVTAKGAAGTSAATQYAYVASTTSGLSSLVPSQGSLSPAFATGTLSYVASVANDVASLTLTPTTIDPTSVVRVNGVITASGSASAPVALAVGSNTIVTVVTAQDGATTSSYAVQVIRRASAVATLADLSLSTGALSPTFASSTTAYSASVLNATTSITITPTVTDPTASVTVNGVAVASGAPSGAIALGVGANTITTVVTAQNGLTTTTYSVTVTRGPSTVSTLSNLVLSSGPLSPTFASGVTDYSASVPNATASVTLTPTASQGDATITVNGATVPSGAASGPIALDVGANTLTVSILAQDGATRTNYAVVVTRGEAAPVAGAASLTLAYNAPATATPLALSGGPAASVAVETGPANGAVIVTGLTVTYQPTTGFSGSDSFTYRATGPGGVSGLAVMTLTVSPPTLSIDPSSLAAGQRGTAYNQSITAVGGQGPYSFVVSQGALPQGLTLSATGVLSGTPEASGTFGFAITATDASTGAGPFAVTRAYSLSISAPTVTLSSARLQDGTVGAAYAQSITATGGTAPYSFAVTGGALPAGLTLAVDGSLSGVPTTSGPATFTVTATDAASVGTGGPYSASATYSITIGDAVPVAGPSDLSVNYGAAATSVPLALTGGPATSLAVVTPPTRGTAVVSGTSIAYTPNVGAYGADSFSYVATGPGGVSGTATVTVTVGAPALAITPTVLPDGQEDVAYLTTLTATGGAEPYTFAVTGGALPAGLSLSAAGVLSGTPIADGDYAFVIRATDSSSGAGPASASQAFTLRIALPAPPVARPSPAVVGAEGGASGGKPIRIDLSALVTGDYDEIRIGTPPQHGSLVLESAVAPAAATPDASVTAGPRVTAIYTAAAGYVGPDSFTFVAVGPGGTSAPASVSIMVAGLNPTARDLTAATEQGRPVTINLSETATEGPFTAAAIVSVTPTGSAETRLIESGPVGARAYAVTVTPRADFEGQVVVTYTISNSIGVSAPARVTVTVQARPDPSADPTVRALSTAQAQAARLFATTQLGNFNRRNEQLRAGTEGQGQGLGLSLSNGMAGMSREPLGDLPWIERERDAMAERDASLNLLPDNASRLDAQGRGDAGTTLSPAVANGNGDGGARATGSVSGWSGGAITVGDFNQTSRTSRFDVSTSGISAGADVKLGDQLIVGAGGGYGSQRTEIGEDGDGQLDGESWIGAIYGSWRPVSGAFIDGVLGYGSIDLDTRRLAPNGLTAEGEREGSMLMGSLTTGWDRTTGSSRYSTYGRVDYLSTDLDAYAETGAGLYSLSFAERTLSSVTGALGVKGERVYLLRSGVLTQSGRLEWRHEFSGLDGQQLDYSDLGGFRYLVEGERWIRDEFAAEVGLEVTYESGLAIGIDLGASVSDAATSATLKVLLAKRF